MHSEIFLVIKYSHLLSKENNLVINKDLGLSAKMKESLCRLNHINQTKCSKKSTLSYIFSARNVDELNKRVTINSTWGWGGGGGDLLP